MRIDEKNVVPKIEPEQQHQALKFFFTPVDEAVAGRPNPLAKATTWYPEIIEALRAKFGADVTNVEEYAGEQTVYVRKTIIADVCRYLKEEQSFVYLSDLGGLDRFVDDDRYEVFYNLVSFEKRKRIRLKIRVDESQMSVPTITNVFRAANWNEREVLDMFGIQFDGHPDLRRMFMPEDFEYYPLRKEFPLLGIPGSLPLPPQTPEGDVQFDPFPAAHGSRTPKSFEEPESRREV